MRREPPILSNKKRNFSDLASHLSCVYAAVIGWFLYGISGSEVRMVENRPPVTVYTIGRPKWFAIVPLALLAIVTASAFATAYLYSSYIELYWNRIYVVPLRLFPRENLLHRILCREEIQPMVFTYQEIEDIRYERFGRLIIRPAGRDFHYACDCSKKFAGKVIAEFQRLKAAHEVRDAKGE